MAAGMIIAVKDVKFEAVRSEVGAGWWLFTAAEVKNKSGCWKAGLAVYKLRTKYGINMVDLWEQKK